MEMPNRRGDDTYGEKTPVAQPLLPEEVSTRSMIGVYGHFVQLSRNDTFTSILKLHTVFGQPREREAFVSTLPDWVDNVL